LSLLMGDIKFHHASQFWSMGSIIKRQQKTLNFMQAKTAGDAAEI